MGRRTHPHKRFVLFLVIILYISTDTPLPSVAVSVHPMRHPTSQTQKTHGGARFSCLMPAHSFPTSRKRKTCPQRAHFMFSAGSPPPNHSLQHLPPPDAMTQPQDTTTRRGGWVGTKTRTRDNDEGGDGPSCPSSQNVRFFLLLHCT